MLYEVITIQLEVERVSNVLTPKCPQLKQWLNGNDWKYFAGLRQSLSLLTKARQQAVYLFF